MIPAHRASYLLNKGKIPDGLVVRHRCDNPICVNPDHLTVGTQKDNMQDCLQRGRFNALRGEAHHGAKLTSGQVVEIRARLGDGADHSILAAQFGVGKEQIRRIGRGDSWREGAAK